MTVAMLSSCYHFRNICNFFFNKFFIKIFHLFIHLKWDDGKLGLLKAHRLKSKCFAWNEKKRVNPMTISISTHLKPFQLNGIRNSAVFNIMHFSNNKVIAIRSISIRKTFLINHFECPFDANTVSTNFLCAKKLWILHAKHTHTQIFDLNAKTMVYRVNVSPVGWWKIHTNYRKCGWWHTWLKL